MKRLLVMVAMMSLAGCEGIFPAPDWQQMIDQHKDKAFASSRFFPDGRAMQPPPAGTVPHDAIVGQPQLTDGRVNGAYETDFPVPLTMDLLQEGRVHYETYCSPCHGLTGTAETPVAERMTLRRPPPLVAPPVTTFPVGRIFQVISHGYGLMPSYARDLDVKERWAVVAYVRALELSHAVPLDSLPDDVRAQAEHELARRAAGTVDKPPAAPPPEREEQLK